MSRNKNDIKNELQFFKENNIRLKVIDLPTTIMELPDGQAWVFDMVNNILIEVLGTIAEQERITIRLRQREGIDAAKLRGKHLGRPRSIMPENWDEIVHLWRTKKITACSAIKMSGLSRSVFYRNSKLVK